MASQRGAFIVIEGLDRSGKTTQVQKLADALSNDGHKVKALRFPDRTTVIGKMINEYLTSQSELDDHVIHLLFSANRWELAKQLIKDIEDGYTLVCDRYYYSGMVYSVAKHLPDLSFKWARAPEVGLPRPDLVIFLDLDPEEAGRRGGYGDEKYEKIEVQEIVRSCFRGLKQAGEEEAEDMIVIDAGRSVEDVHETCVHAVKYRIPNMMPKLRKVGDWKRTETLDIQGAPKK